VLADDPQGRWTLRRVEAPGLDWFRDLYRRIGAEWLWFSRLRMTDAKLAATIQSPLIEMYALVQDGRDEGVLELDFRNAGECELRLFGVTADLIGSGAGRWLMNRALELIWSRPVTRVWVHTCSLDHPAALAFYQRSGFRPFRRQIEISDDPRLDGTVRRSAARHVPIIE
jgi:GNAT superfamily N-acetyltransferase